MGEKEGKGSGGREREPPPPPPPLPSSLGRGGSFVADVGGAAKKKVQLVADGVAALLLGSVSRVRKSLVA